MKNHIIFVLNRSIIDPKSHRPWAILGRGSRQGWSRDRKLTQQIYFLLAKMTLKMCFLKIPKIENGTKTARWRQDRHRDPLKMVSGRGSGKTWKINEKQTGKREVLGEENMPKPCKGHRFQGFSVFRKVEKSMPNGLPKSMKIGPKCDLGPSLVDLSSTFGDFGRCRKIDDFWCRSGGVKK